MDEDLEEVDTPHSPTKLSRSQSVSLHDVYDEPTDEDANKHHHHDHGPKKPSILTAVPSAIINFLLMFGLCCAYGMIMFEDDFNSRHRGIGVKMNLGSAFFVGLLYACVCGIPVAIGGPDLNPVVFLGMFVNSIAEELAKANDLQYPGGRRLLEQCSAATLLSCDPVEGLRRLASAGAKDAEFCTGEHYGGHEKDCDAFHSQLRATTIFCVAASSLLFGVLFFVLGKFKLTKFITYIPTNIVEAFLSCVGYKVFKYALKFCKYEPRQFIPAACVGVPMYFAKAFHVGNPAIVIPTMLLVPLGIFYAVVFGQGGSLETARDDALMFPIIKNDNFWSVWTSTVGDPGSINLAAAAKILADLPVMIIVVVLDCMLKLSATENKMPVRPDMDKEMMLFGKGNLLTALTGSSVGYMQLKFNVINFGVMGNVKDRRAGMMYAVFVGVCYFWSTDLINYLPRFFLSSLLFFAGSGFVAENLWGSRHYLSPMDWVQILLILAVFILTESLVNAVVVGGLLCGITFIVRYASVSPIHGRLMRGGEIVSNVRRTSALEVAIANISNYWVLVVRLKGYLFFASAQKLTKWLIAHVEQQNRGVPAHKQLQWLILDCSFLDGMDCSGAKAFKTFATVSKDSKVTLLWSGVTHKFADELLKRDTIDSKEYCYPSLNDAMKFTENEISKHIHALQEKWMNVNMWFGLEFEFVRMQASMDPFKGILSHDSARFGCPWDYCKRMTIEKFSSMLWKPGELCSDLFLVYTGRVGLFTHLPEPNHPSWDAPICIYTHGCLINCEALLHRRAQDYAIALEDGELIYWSEFDWGRMARERPNMTSAILETTLRQEKNSSNLMSHHQNFGITATRSSMDATVVTPQECGRAHEEDMQQWIHDMEVAIELDRQGFYNSVEHDGSETRPDLPVDIARDLSIAYATFAEAPEEGGHSSLPASELARACAYAGLFEVSQKRVPGHVKEFLKEEFFSVGHEAAMLPLDGTMELRLQEIFWQYADEHQEVDRTQLVMLFKNHFYRAISVYEVNSICDLFGNKMEMKIDLDTFLAIMSRCILTHESDWRLLKGVQELFGTDSAENADFLTPQELIGKGVSLAEAEELIWFANCCCGGICLQSEDEPEAFDFRLLKAIFIDTENRPYKLPPEPIKPNEILQASEAGYPRVAARLSQIAKITPVVDFRQFGKAGYHELSKNGILDFEPTRSAGVEDGEANGALVSSDQIVKPSNLRQKVHQIMDEPLSSRAANIVAAVMGLMILVAVFTLILQPLTESPSAEIDIWLTFECFFTVAFTVELVVRFIVADAMGTMTRTQFITMPMNICDFMSILPFYVGLVLKSDIGDFKLLRLLHFARITRLVRLARLARLERIIRIHPGFAPTAVIFVVIWGIYTRSKTDKK